MIEVTKNDWTSEYSNQKTVREIPAIMFEKLAGEKVEYPDNFIEGLPEMYYQKISDFIDECESNSDDDE